MNKNAKEILLANLENFSPKIKVAVESVLFDLQKAEEKITEFETANKKICKCNPRVEFVDETHCKFNGEIFTRNKDNGYYEIPKSYLVNNNRTDENGNLDKEKNDIEHLILMERGEHTKLHSPLTINKKKKFVCKVCGKTFEVNNHGKNCYCSKECKNASQRKYRHKYDEERICQFYSKKFFVYKHKPNKFCSSSCSGYYSHREKN